MKELHVKSLLPVRLDKYLMDQFPALGMGRLNKALRENKIKLNGKKQPLSTRVQNGDIIKLFLNDDQLENRPTPAAVFVYEDDDIIIASKPAGIAVDGPDSDTLLRRVQTKLAAEGKSVTFISSEIDEMLRVCSRLVVMRDRQVVGELRGSDLNQSSIMKTIAGGDQ